MLKAIKSFSLDESGAVTVDWVVLTAAIIGVSLGVVGSMTSGTNALGDKVETRISGIGVGETPD